MLCKDVMKSNPTALTAQDTLRTAARVMRDREIGFAPIVDSASNVIGVVTDRDLVVRALADGQSGDVALSTVMTDEVVACAVDDDVTVAAERLRDSHRSRIVVLDEQNKLAGVISLSDIADVLGERDAIGTVREVNDRGMHARASAT
jgi:CBS domain-containing protein